MAKSEGTYDAMDVALAMQMVLMRLVDSLDPETKARFRDDFRLWLSEEPENYILPGSRISLLPARKYAREFFERVVAE